MAGVGLDVEVSAAMGQLQLEIAQCERRTKPEEKLDTPGTVIELLVEWTGRWRGVKSREREEPLRDVEVVHVSHGNL